MIHKDYFNTHWFTSMHNEHNVVKLSLNNFHRAGIYYAREPYIIIFGPEDYLPLILEKAVNLYPHAHIYYDRHQYKNV